MWNKIIILFKKDKKYFYNQINFWESVVKIKKSNWMKYIELIDKNIEIIFFKFK